MNIYEFGKLVSKEATARGLKQEHKSLRNLLATVGALTGSLRIGSSSIGKDRDSDRPNDGNTSSGNPPAVSTGATDRYNATSGGSQTDGGGGMEGL